MATTRRLQVTAGLLAVVLLVGARLLVGGEHDRATDRSMATTTIRASTADSTTTSTTRPTLSTALDDHGLRFTDITDRSGLDEPRRSGDGVPFDRYTGGAAVADYDGDGDQDVFLPRLGLPNRLLVNDGSGHFADKASEAGVTGTDPGNGSAAAVWADVDGDGDLDLFTTGAGTGSATLFRNDGRGHFVDATERSGLTGLAGNLPLGTVSFGAAFSDWDHDGALDLVVTDWYLDPLRDQLVGRLASGRPIDRLDHCELAAERRAKAEDGAPRSRTRLYRGDGNGHFADVTASSGVDADRIIAMQPRFADVDGDGWDDLFLTGDFCTSRLYRNDAGRGFVDATEEAGVGTDENGMGSVLADIDGDGNLDWFVSAIAGVNGDRCPDDPTYRCTGNRLYQGDGAGHFTDATDELGVRDASWAWGAVAADFDGDGHLDLAVANGFTGDIDPSGADPGDVAALRAPPTRFWFGGTSPLMEAASTVGLDHPSSGKALVAFDVDGDLDPDLLEVTDDGTPHLYRNDTAIGPRHHRLVVRLRQPGPNPFAVGAKVTVDLGDGSPRRRASVVAGGSYGSGDPTDLGFGLGSVSQVRVEVRWPDDPTPQLLDAVEADQVLAITRPR